MENSCSEILIPGKRTYLSNSREIGWLEKLQLSFSFFHMFFFETRWQFMRDISSMKNLKSNSLPHSKSVFLKLDRFLFDLSKTKVKRN